MRSPINTAGLLAVGSLLLGITGVTVHLIREMRPPAAAPLPPSGLAVDALPACPLGATCTGSYPLLRVDEPSAAGPMRVVGPMVVWDVPETFSVASTTAETLVFTSSAGATVEINLDTGHVTHSGTPDEAAVVFWAAVSRLVGREPR